MMKKMLGAACALGLIAMLSGPATAATVKVGVLSAASGPFARYYRQIKQAIEVYQKQHGKTVNGNDIQIIYRDVGGPNPSRARQLAQELILRDKVQFLTGFIFTPNAAAVADVITQSKTPSIIFVAATGVTTRQSPYFVRTSDTLPQITAPFGKWAVKQGIKKVATLVADYAPGIDAEKYFIKTFTAGGGKVVGRQRTPLQTTDFAPFFERVLTEKPDALFIFGPSGPGTVTMVKTWAQRLKPEGIRLLCTNEVQQIDLPKIGPSALGVVSASYYTASNETPLNKTFRSDLVSMFGKDAMPDVESVGAYDGMHLIYAVVRKLGPHFNPDQAVKLMAGMKFTSPRGPIAIDAKERDIIQNIYIRRVEKRGGALVNVDFDTIPMVKDPWKLEHPEK